jgi:hypothetical protein
MSLEALSRGLRAAGGILSPDVQKSIMAEDAEAKTAQRQEQLIRLKQTLDQEAQKASPEYQMKMEALKNERLFREAVGQAGGDFTKIASAAAQYGKPELAVNIYNQQEQRAARAQQAAEALETRKLQLQQAHEAKMAQIQGDAERRAETARHNQAMEVLNRESNAARLANANLGHQLRLLQLELAGDRQKLENLRRVDTEATRLQGALEKAGLPEADTVLASVEKALETAPQAAEYLSGPKSLIPDLAVPDEVKFARQAFQKLFNITLKNRSGAAVTIPELERLKKEFATGAWKTPQQLIEGVNQARNVINQHYRSVSAGFAPEALETYNERIRQYGGRVVLDAPKRGGASGGWTVEEVK